MPWVSPKVFPRTRWPEAATASLRFDCPLEKWHWTGVERTFPNPSLDCGIAFLELKVLGVLDGGGGSTCLSVLGDRSGYGV